MIFISSTESCTIRTESLFRQHIGVIDEQKFGHNFETGDIEENEKIKDEEG